LDIGTDEAVPEVSTPPVKADARFHRLKRIRSKKSLVGESIKFHTLEEITHNFSEKQKVGSGGYGDVYRVINNWMERLQGTPGHSSQEINILRLKACVNIALRCVDADRNKRPYIKDIVNELEELESNIKKMPVLSDHQLKDQIHLQRSSDSNVLAVDPMKEISCCLQLTNKTEGSIAFNIKTNQTKYYAEPKRGIISPCSRRYVSVTLRAQEAVSECHDMLPVQSVNVSEGLTSDEITKDFFKKVMMGKVVDVVQLPIVYVARDQLC
ncbi:hypothetical protein BAE44_0026400, partial [Dichanthelium oligosanthes]